MGLRLIRQSSNTPSVSNDDDARMVRYAYGGYDGVVKSFKTELAATVDGSSLKIGSGCVVLHGWEVEIDANGYTVTVDNVSAERYYSVYLEINLATETSEIKTVYDTAGYPTIDVGDDLTGQTTGTARLLLYQFTATSGVIQNVAAKFSVISYVKPMLEDICARLDKLGFRQGSINLADGFTATLNVVTRQGNYVIGTLSLSGFYQQYTVNASSELTVKVGSLPLFFRPKVGCLIGARIIILSSSTLAYSVFIDTSGDIYFRLVNGSTTTTGCQACLQGFNFGYEVDPL